MRFLEYLKWDKDKYSVCFLYAPLDALFLRNQFIPMSWSPYVCAFPAVKPGTKQTSLWSLDVLPG